MGTKQCEATLRQTCKLFRGYKARKQEGIQDGGVYKDFHPNLPCCLPIMMVNKYLKHVLLFVTITAAIPLAASSNDRTPSQVHLAYAGDTGMMVSWNTFCKLDKPTVHWGKHAANLDHTSSSSISVTYQTSTTYNNHVKIDGLEPDTQYFYCPQHGDCDNPHSFRTSRPAGDHTPFVAAVVVDMGTMGALGLTTHVGDGAANPLEPGETNTIQSLASEH